MLRVLVITGADTVDPIGAQAGGRGVTTNVSQTYTSTRDNSWGWLTYCDWAQKGVPTVTGETVDSSYNPSGMITAAVIKKNSTTPTAGTSVTMSTSTPNSGTQITWQYFEILPPAPGAELTWVTGAADFKIYKSSSLTWGAGTLICSGTLNDDNTDTISCSGGRITSSTSTASRYFWKTPAARPLLLSL
jgi:hypothetical protein